MAINPAAVGTSAYELLDGSVSSFYADVDEAISASEVVKGQYRMTINPAYNSPNPVDSNSFTTVGLTQSGPMVVDLENSFISTTIKLEIKPSADLLQATTAAVNADLANGEAGRIGGKTASGMFFGWKRAVEAIERYDILVNSTPIYTQSFCGEESFVMGQVENDLVRKKSPFMTSTYNNIINMDPSVCGTYVVFGPTAGAAGTTILDATKPFIVQIPIKIPVASFPLLKNLKYLLSWMGKWELRLYFSAQNMICCPIPQDVLYSKVAGIAPSALLKREHCKITQMGMNTCVIQANANSNNVAALANNYYFSVITMTMMDVSMNTAQFQIRMDILEMLKQKYMMEKPLTFPVSSFQIARFTGPPQQGQPLSIVLCQAINNCDTLFVLPFEDARMHTVCHNPLITSLQLHAGEYGAYPTQPFNTFADYGKENMRFVNAIMDALNVNGSELTSMNEDVLTAFVPVPMTIKIVSNADGQVNAGSRLSFTGDTVTYDDSNFFIPFPFSTDDDFQGGMSSPSSNINFKLTGNVTTTVAQTTPWVAAFLIDGVIMIRPDPGSDAAKVIWSDRTVC